MRQLQVPQRGGCKHAHLQTRNGPARQVSSRLPLLHCIIGCDLFLHRIISNYLTIKYYKIIIQDGKDIVKPREKSEVCGPIFHFTLGTFINLDTYN